MEILQSLLNDRELRSQVSRLLTNKVKSDAKSLETNALLSRKVLAVAAQQGRGEPADASALRGLVKEHLDFYESLVAQTMAFHQRLAERLHGFDLAPGREGAATLTMRLAAPQGRTVRAPFQLENNRSTTLSAGFEITPFVTERGDAYVVAEVAFDPPRLELQPGQVGRVELVLVVAPTFVPGQVYLATVTVSGLDGTQLLVRLEVQPPEAKPAASAPVVSAPAPAAAQVAAARGTRKRAAPADRQAVPPGKTASAVAKKAAKTATKTAARTAAKKAAPAKAGRR